MGTQQALEKFRDFYNTFSTEWLGRLEELYAPNFQFNDPFHSIAVDYTALRKYFTKILTSLHHSKFVVEDAATGTDGSYVRWRWEWKRGPRDSLRVVPGVTHLRFAADDRIVYHRDLFDAAEGFYESLPVVGSLLRTIKKRIG